MLLTTQDLDEADRLADRIAVIDQGLVIAEGTPDELKTQVGGERLEIHLCDGDRGEEAVVRSGVDRERPALPRGRDRPRPGRRAPRDDRRRRPPPRRGRDRDRRHRRQHADPRRRLPDADRPRGRAGGRGDRGSQPGDRASLRGLGHARAREAEPAADPAPAGPARRLHGAADPVRPALRLRLRRGDPDARLRLRRLPDARDHRPVDLLRRLRDRARAVGRSEEGAHGPLPLAADDPLRAADRAHARRRRHERLPADRDARGRTARRLQLLGQRR